MSAPRPFLRIESVDGQASTLDLSAEQERFAVGRLRELNDVALEPDPQLLVTRQAHCLIERDGGGWWVVDNGSVNGTFVRRGSAAPLEQVNGRMPLTDGTVIQVLGQITEAGEPRYWSITFNDPQRTRPAMAAVRLNCIEYDWPQARVYRVEGTLRSELPQLRPQEHKLIRYMAQRNQANGGVPVLCTFDELITALWGDEALHTQDDVTRIVYALRQKIERDPGTPVLIETARGLGYRLRTCPRLTG